MSLIVPYCLQRCSAGVEHVSQHLLFGAELTSGCRQPFPQEQGFVVWEGASHCLQSNFEDGFW